MARLTESFIEPHQVTMFFDNKVTAMTSPVVWEKIRNDSAAVLQLEEWAGEYEEKIRKIGVIQ